MLFEDFTCINMRIRNMWWVFNWFLKKGTLNTPLRALENREWRFSWLVRRGGGVISQLNISLKNNHFSPNYTLRSKICEQEKWTQLVWCSFSALLPFLCNYTLLYKVVIQFIFCQQIFCPMTSALYDAIICSYLNQIQTQTHRWSWFAPMHHNTWRIHGLILCKVGRSYAKWNKLYFVVALLRRGAVR